MAFGNIDKVISTIVGTFCEEMSQYYCNPIDHYHWRSDVVKDVI